MVEAEVDNSVSLMAVWSVTELVSFAVASWAFSVAEWTVGQWDYEWVV